MNYPVHRGANGAPIEHRPNDDFQEPQYDENWDEGASAFPLAYAYPEDEPASDDVSEQEAADIEATLLSDLEAAATAFWTDAEPSNDSLNATDAEDADYDPPAEGRNEFHWDVTPEDLVGPEARRALIDFRPPRARKRAATRLPNAEEPVINFDVHATPDGAFADDLAARNKEFYELLKSDKAARKIAVPARPASGPGFETIFPRAEPAPRRVQNARAERAGNGLGRQALAAAVLAIVVGGGIFIIANQFSVPATSDDEIAGLSGETSAAAPERLAPANEPIDDRSGAIVPGVDPGTLTTPPLYERPDAAPAPLDRSGSAATTTPPELAAVPLRTQTAPNTTSVAPTLPAAEAPPPVATIVPAEEPPATATIEPAPAPAVQEPRRETVELPPANEPAHETESRQITAGSGKVNSAVNMRAGPDNGEKVVRVLRAGTQVEILNSCKVWCEVSAGGDRGFIFQRFITRTGGSAQTEPTDLNPQRAVQASLPSDAEVAPREEARGPLNLLRFGRPNN